MSASVDVQLYKAVSIKQGRVRRLGVVTEMLLPIVMYMLADHNDG